MSNPIEIAIPNIATGAPGKPAPAITSTSGGVVGRMSPDFRVEQPQLKTGEWIDELGRVRTRTKTPSEREAEDHAKHGKLVRKFSPEEWAQHRYDNRPRKTFGRWMSGGADTRMSPFEK